MLATGAYPQPRRDTLVKRELSSNLQTVSGLPFAAEELQTGDDTQHDRTREATCRAQCRKGAGQALASAGP